MQKGMTPLKMDPEATVDNHKLVSASEGLFLSNRLEGIKTNYCNCTGPDCLTLSCPCFSTGFLCLETCDCRVCGNALDIKPGIEMTLEEIDSKYPCPDVLKDVICTCEKDGCTKMCTGCSMSCQYYAKLNPFEKKKNCIENPIESANSSLAFNSTDDGTNQRHRILKQQIGFANQLTLDHRVERVPELSKLHSQQQITTYISPYTSSQSMMRNPTVPQCSDQQLNPANSLLINQRVPRIPEFYLIPEQKKINSIFPQSFSQKIEPNNSLAFNQTVPKVPELHHFGSQQKITSSTSPATFNPPTRSYSNNFNAKSYYEELCWTKKLPYKDCEQDATMIVHKNRTSKKCTSQNTKKPSKVGLNGCLCQMFSCAQRNCKCLKYGVSCSDQCKCSNCQNPHGKRNAADIH